jgi:hypothetical protein
MLIGGIITYTISRQIRMKLDQLVKMNQEIAKGNLYISKMEYDGKDEIG